MRAEGVLQQVGATVRRWLGSCGGAGVAMFAFTLGLEPASVLAQTAAAVLPPSDSVVAAVVSLLQTGDASRRGVFLSRALTPGARAADSARIDRLLARLHQQGAPYEVVEVGRFGRHVMAKLRSPRARRVLSLDIATDRNDPSGLGDIGVLESHAAVLDSIQWPTGRLNGSGEVALVIRRNLTRLADAGAFSGTVYVANGDSVILAEGYGLANREDSIPNTVRTRFSIASMGKMFTATAIMQLVDADRLRLDDTLAKVLPGYPNTDRAERITIRQLLEHTAGMGDQWSTPRRPVAGLTGHLAIAGAVAHAPLLFEPGTRWSYSNEGYNVLAAVVEELSGESFHDYLQRHIFGPAGMTETVMASGSDDIVPHRAVGYRSRVDDPLGVEAPRANWSFIAGSSMGGAGGGHSTVGDLARFGTALRTGVLVSDTMRDAMWTARWPIPGHEGESYGLGAFVGAFVGEFGGRVAVGHGGGGGGSGIDTGFRQFTDGSYTVVVLTNIDPPTATDITRALVRLLATQPGPRTASGHGL